ncbi:heme ABC exporter ATP-binding protein CcmA [Phenylobacterium sp.]|jgi:heme exporter protein A|uniref:heme ABC exporter ATP-binding protein CcmA n=1 Tax=Phenylobacterium sp. TaxID=1871053 RepID=UPI002E301FFF|nr:heme ABC exporter ATP-binding protein CcmA [Phenylobacterium sp.]HEX2558663.1 heme ABC exporter ATP-binding protein CcmA [Phenylobacterium sp.]
MIDTLTVEDLAVRRGERLLFSGLGLTLSAGEAVALVGRNGSGKTSLLRAVAGLVRPDAGRIGFGDVDPRDARADGVHLLGHQDGLKPARTGAEELAFWSRWMGGSEALMQAAAERLSLKPLLELEVRRLSAGQRRRVALARLLAAPRPLWLLDEPLSPLDAEWRSRFAELMAEHLAGGGLILAAVHDPLPGASRTLEIPA